MKNLRRRLQVSLQSRKARSKWERGLRDEVAFWDNWFAKGGLKWPDQYHNRLDANLPLAERHARFIDHIHRSTIELLDVGAGPLTLLGKQHPEKVLRITATDALAKQYDQILEKYGIEPPVRTVECRTEELTKRFAWNSFDLVIAQNCLDHSYDPWHAIGEMLRVVRPGCFLLLSHAPNEADRQNHRGLHQWNLAVEANSFFIRGPNGSTNVTEGLAGIAEVQIQSAEPDWIDVSIRKLADPPADL